MCRNTCSLSGDKHLRSMPLPRHVSSPTCKPPTLPQNIRILSPAALCPNVFVPSTLVPAPYLLQSCQKGSFSSPMLCQTNTETTAEAATPFISCALRHTTTPRTPLLQWERRLLSTPGLENGQISLREHAFLMSLCEAGLSEAHNLSKCGKIFTEIGKYTFLTSEGSSAPTADQKTSLSSRLGRDY